MSRQIILLIIVSILALVRWGIVPLNEYNQQLQERIGVKLTRLEKGRQILASKENVEKGLLEIEQLMVAQQSSFPSMPSVEKGQLDVQRRVSGLAREYNVVIESAQWISIDEGSLVSGQLEVYFSGNVNDVVQWHLAIEQMGEWVSAERVDLNTSNQRLRTKQQGTAKGSLVVQILFTSQERKNAS